MEGRSAWCAFEGRVIRQVLPLFLSFVCFFSSILLALSLPLHRLSDHHLFDCEGLKAVWSPSKESSATSTGPCKGSEGTAPLGPGSGSPGAGLAGASGAGAVFTSASSFLVSIFSPFCLYVPVLGALDVRRGVAAGAQRQTASCYQKHL